MTKWLNTNWGNLASVIGLLFSIYAVVAARKARTAIQNFQSKQRCLNAILQLEKAIFTAKQLLNQTTGKRLSSTYCDELRELLNEVRDSEFVSDDEQNHLRTQISQWRVPPERGSPASSALRKLTEELSLLRNRLRREFEGNL